MITLRTDIWLIPKHLLRCAGFVLALCLLAFPRWSMGTRSKRCAGFVLILCLLSEISQSNLTACPFCVSIKPTLSQQRESARIVLLGEVFQRKNSQENIRVKIVFKGSKILDKQETLSIKLKQNLPVGRLVLLLENSGKVVPLKQMQWKTISVSELQIAYFAGAPSLRKPIIERLKYFARYLEHRDSLIASDAYYEFAHATFDQVRQASKYLDAAKLRSWLVDPQITGDRKGFYAIALGFTATDKHREANKTLLKKLIMKSENDFRSGFDGVLCGYLVIEGKEALQLIEKRYLKNPKSAHGDVRHAISALQVYYEFGDRKKIELNKIKQAMRHLLKRSAFASSVIADLARWEDWSSLSEVAKLYHKKDYPQPATRDSVIGYLTACPLPQVGQELAKLRKQDPQGVAEAEKALLLIPQSSKD